MNFPFFNRLPLKKVVVNTPGEAGTHAKGIIDKILHDIPDVLLVCIVDAHSGRVAASYTSSPAYNPNQISLRNGKLLRMIMETQSTHSWLGGPLTDISILLEDQFHYIRPLPQGSAYCFLAARMDDVNLAIAKETVRRYLE